MTGRLLALGLFCGLCGLAAPGALGVAWPAAADPLRERSVEVQVGAAVEVPAGAARVEIWLPYPESDDYQRVSGVEVSAPVPFEVLKEPTHGNAVLHLAVQKPEQRQLEVGIRFRVARREHVRRDLRPARAATGRELPAEAAQWLKPEKKVPLDDTIRRLAGEVTRGKATDLDKARAIYDYVVATMSYDKSGTGWGNGDIYWACDAKRGNCTDFHALFIGLSRAVGIPARFEIGLPLPPDRGEGEIAGYHCWAEFYLAGDGWVPVDASEAKRHPEKKDYFFGAHDENRVQLSVGRDLLLAPRQQGEPLNYFVYPYVEIDGKPSAQVKKTFHYRDLETRPGEPARAGARR